MSTAEELEKLKDSRNFELLATAVLCKAERDYRAILHSGLNAQGQHDKSPVDGFCRVPGSNPPHFILVEHTIDSNLERKWLFDHRIVKPAAKGRKKQLSESDDGDLLKAGRLAQQRKAEFPEAKFTVVLTTNQGLKPELYFKVEKKAEDLGVSVDPWDRSRIARSLDIEPEGQWLRKKYLGLEAELLSESLLRELCKKSLNEYCRKQFLTSPEQWVFRQIDQQVEKEVENQSRSIHLLIGNSGCGKSSAAYQIGKKYLEMDGYSLWLSENVLVDSDSLESALDKTLHSLYPNLMPDSGGTALRLLKGRERLLLIAADVNRTSSPTNLLQKLVNWSKPVSSGESNAKLAPSRRFLVCPVWSDIVRSITPDINKTSWIGSVFIGTLTSEEGLEAVQGAVSFADIKLTSAEAGVFAEKLGNDPVLIGLFAELLDNLDKAQLNELSQIVEDVTDFFIKQAVKEVSQTGNLLADEYHTALSNLATHMLQQRKLNPRLEDIKKWLGSSSEDMKAFRQLVKHGKLCCVEEEKLVFRHDRLREALLVESMGYLLNNTTEPLDIFWEPYYAEIIGQAIVRYPQNERFLKELCDRLPLALVEAIRCFGTVNDNYQQAIVDKVREWANIEVSNDSTLNSVYEAICWALLRTDSPCVLEITEKFSCNRIALLARLRNGCAKSGVQYFIKSDFAFRDNLINQVLEQAKRHYKDRILMDLKRILNSQDISDEWRNGALLLSGFLEFPELEKDIETCWNQAPDKSAILYRITWAAIQVFNFESKFLDTLVECWSELAKKDDPDCENPFELVTYSLKMILRFCTNSNAINYFINQCRNYESLSGQSSVCSQISHPDVIEFIFSNTANLKATQSDEHELINYWEDSLGSICANLRHECMVGRHNLSPTTMRRLEAWWQDQEVDGFVRQKAFYLWCESTDKSQIETLKTVLPNSPFFSTAVWHRAKLEDKSVITAFLSLLSLDINLFDVGHYIWCDELLIATDQHLESLQSSIPTDFSGGRQNEHYILASLLRQIPGKQAERLLEKHWKYLGYSPEFIQSALYIGTQKCLELATSSIDRCSNDVPVFEFISDTFGFLDGQRQQYLTVKHLERLLPYLDRLSQISLGQLVETCQKMGIPEWGKQHLFALLDERNRKDYYPSENDLLLELDRFATNRHGEALVIFWLEDFDRQQDSKIRALSAARHWLSLYPTLRSLQITAACIQATGTRKDLSILDECVIEGSPDEIAKIKANTRFAVYRRTLE